MTTSDIIALPDNGSTNFGTRENHKARTQYSAFWTTPARWCWSTVCAAWRRFTPDRQLGDGGFMMNSQEIETAIRMKLNCCVGVGNDVLRYDPLEGAPD
jgi:hypothetical protein